MSKNSDSNKKINAILEHKLTEAMASLSDNISDRVFVPSTFRSVVWANNLKIHNSIAEIHREYRFPVILCTKSFEDKCYVNDSRLPRRKLGVVHVCNGDDRIVDSEEDDGL